VAYAWDRLDQLVGYEVLQVLKMVVVDPVELFLEPKQAFVWVLHQAYVHQGVVWGNNFYQFHQ
jgi:hypothetical protein